MIRLLLRLFGIKDFEPNESISVLKEQLAYERDKNRELTETLLNIIKPKTYEAPPQEIVNVAQSSALFSRRRAALEARDREEARIKQASPNLGQPDDNLKKIELLEVQLGVQESEAK